MTPCGRRARPATCKYYSASAARITAVGPRRGELVRETESDDDATGRYMVRSGDLLADLELGLVEGRRRALASVLAHGRHSPYLSVVDARGWRALHFAAAAGHKNAVRAQ